MVELVCSVCGKTYRRRPSHVAGSKYCSVECKRKGLSKIITRICQYCGKEYSGTAHELSRNRLKFCSARCAALARKDQRVITRVCQHCGKEYSGSPYQMKFRKKFCSVECMTAALSKPRVCQRCGQLLEKTRGKKIRRKYCDSCRREVLKENGKRNGALAHAKALNLRRTRICRRCGKEFVLPPLVQCHKRYCDDCRRIVHRENGAKGNLVLAKRGKRTSAELQAREFLASLGLQFDEQVQIGPYVADFVLKDQKTIIEVDGEYWHSRQDAKEADTEKEQYLSSLGYRVFRLAQSANRPYVLTESSKRALLEALA